MRTPWFALTVCFASLAYPAPAAPETEASSQPSAPVAAFPGVEQGPAEAFHESEAPRQDPNVVTLRQPAARRWWDAPAFDRRVTLVVKDTDLNGAIDALGRAANMSLLASGGSKARKKVTLNLRNAPLRDVMLAVANLYDLIWFQSGEVYTLTYLSATAKRQGTPPAAAPRQRVIVVPQARAGAPRR